MVATNPIYRVCMIMWNKISRAVKFEPVELRALSIQQANTNKMHPSRRL